MLYLNITYIEKITSSWNDEVGSRVTRKAFRVIEEYNDALRQIEGYLKEVKVDQAESFNYISQGEAIRGCWING